MDGHRHFFAVHFPDKKTKPVVAATSEKRQGTREMRQSRTRFRLVRHWRPIWTVVAIFFMERSPGKTKRNPSSWRFLRKERDQEKGVSREHAFDLLVIGRPFGRSSSPILRRVPWIKQVKPVALPLSEERKRKRKCVNLQTRFRCVNLWRPIWTVSGIFFVVGSPDETNKNLLSWRFPSRHYKTKMRFRLFSLYPES